MIQSSTSICTFDDQVPYLTSFAEGRLSHFKFDGSLEWKISYGGARVRTPVINIVSPLV